MARIRIMLLLGLVFGLLPGLGLGQDEDSTSESLIRLLSPELRRMEKRLSEIDQEMKSLPVVREHPWGSRYGHRSADLLDETTPDWLQVDLGEQRKVDMVAMIPVNLSYRGELGAGYGFPKRFKVEISDYPDMRDAVVLVDSSKSDVLNPGKYPLVFEVAPTSGRYVRITSVKHVFDEGTYFWALEELMVMEGNMNVAASMGSKVIMSSLTDLFPQWASVRIIDGQSGLGMPVDVTSPSRTLGYMSAKLNMSEGRDPILASLKKWCAVDLDEPEVIEQVRLLPLETDTYDVTGGRGFPRKFSVQLSNDPAFSEVIWETSRGTFSLGYPAGCSINIVVPDVKAQYVRVLVESMWSRDDFYICGLSELQVYGSNRNLSLGRRAYAKDQIDKPSEAGWDPSYLVDGYTSRYQLIEWPKYLILMQQRGRLEREKVVLGDQRTAKFQLGRKMLGGAGLLLAVLVVVGWVWIMVRHRVLRRHEAEQLRQQIARDLHDDIGSNLGGIILLSEIGSQHSTDEDSRSDFDSIHQAAEEASTSMRDIVWLIQREEVGLKDFVTRMRQSLRMILKHSDVSVEVEPAVFRDRPLGLLFRRHVFLAFKEVVNNVRKHAQTGQVTVKIEIEADRLRFTVQDNGVGFNPETAGASGYGMGNLKRRASRVLGSIRIDSTPGKGTTVIFEAPFGK